ncbi:hypothetical protein GCM10012286_36720 [Streptomyces lasiicapitis]|uniref:Uncharacterized protein n=1 Tax=Streptomyces lasiicapitis TaxID=1923961 RepID=A0ABQ2M2L0_9ACTN|nr:hypothetical protein GCM10012286_36720 [Streptomyces lasiicapitis]
MRSGRTHDRRVELWRVHAMFGWGECDRGIVAHARGCSAELGGVGAEFAGFWINVAVCTCSFGHTQATNWSAPSGTPQQLTTSGLAGGGGEPVGECDDEVSEFVRSLDDERQVE